MKLLGFIFLFQRTYLKSKIWSDFINFLSLNKVLQNLEEFRLDLNNSKWNPNRNWERALLLWDHRNLACYGSNGLGLLGLRHRATPRACAMHAKSALAVPRAWALQPGGTSSYGSSADKGSPGLALIQLRDVNYTPLHRKLHDTHGRGGLHGEAVAWCSRSPAASQRLA
jgi:hypothetical protein